MEVGLKARITGHVMDFMEPAGLLIWSSSRFGVVCRENLGVFNLGMMADAGATRCILKECI